VVLYRIVVVRSRGAGLIDPSCGAGITWSSPGAGRDWGAGLGVGLGAMSATAAAMVARSTSPRRFIDAALDLRGIFDSEETAPRSWRQH